MEGRGPRPYVSTRLSSLFLLSSLATTAFLFFSSPGPVSSPFCLQGGGWLFPLQTSDRSEGRHVSFFAEAAAGGTQQPQGGAGGRVRSLLVNLPLSFFVHHRLDNAGTTGIL